MDKVQENVKRYIIIATSIEEQLSEGYRPTAGSPEASARTARIVEIAKILQLEAIEFDK